jgi:integrase
LSARAGTGAVGIEEATMPTTIPIFVGFAKTPWNKGRLIGQKRPLKPKEVWAIRVRLQLEGRKRDLALFNLAIDSKLRGCDLVLLQVDDVSVGGRVRDRATVVQKKTGRPVQFEISEQTRSSIRDWLSEGNLKSGHYLFPSRRRGQPHISTRQYARIVHAWVESAGLDSSAYGTHSMRRTKAAQIYRKTGNLRAVQLLLGHTKLESTVRYLGIEVDDALSIAEQVEL